MKHRSVIIYGLVLAGLLLTAGWIQFGQQVRSNFQAESKLQLDGTSTVHDWSCNATQVTGFVESNDTNGLTLSNVEVAIPISKLDCGHAAMNKRLQSTMNADQYPNVTYKLNTAKVVANPSPDTYRMQTTGTISMNGVEKPVEMVVEAKKLSGNKLQFTGATPLKMTDFGMKPVVFLAIRTGDEVNIKFDVVSAQ